MRTIHTKRRWVLLGVSVLLLSCVACVQFAAVPWMASKEAVRTEASKEKPISAAPAIAPAQPAVPGAPARGAPVLPSAEVRRGPIREILTLAGWTAASQEDSLSFPSSARVDSIGVVPGQHFEQGDLLVDAGSKDIAKELASSRAKLDSSRAQLERARADLAARLKRATDDFDRLSAGPSASERLAADGSVASAQSALQRADSDLSRLLRGPDAAELQLVEQEVAEAELKAQKAEAELNRLQRGADPADVRTAESQLATAQNVLVRAQAALDKLVRGPDPTNCEPPSEKFNRPRLSSILHRRPRATKTPGLPARQRSRRHGSHFKEPRIAWPRCERDRSRGRLMWPAVRSRSLSWGSTTPRIIWPGCAEVRMSSRLIRRELRSTRPWLDWRRRELTSGASAQAHLPTR
jgi:hypothetical protein